VTKKESRFSAPKKEDRPRGNHVGAKRQKAVNHTVRTIESTSGKFQNRKGRLKKFDLSALRKGAAEITGNSSKAKKGEKDRERQAGPVEKDKKENRWGVPRVEEDTAKNLKEVLE